MADQKNQLRKELIRARGLLSEEALRRSDEAIREQVLTMPEFRDAKVIYSYCSVQSEVDTRGLMRAALEQGKTVAVPVIFGAGQMRPRRLSRMEDLVDGAWGIPTAPESEPWVEEKDIDLILVPGLAFDHGGFRIGYGGGFYDRLLSTARGLAVGLTRECFMLPRVPVEDFDQAVDCIATEKGVDWVR